MYICILRCTYLYKLLLIKKIGHLKNTKINQQTCIVLLEKFEKKKIYLLQIPLQILLQGPKRIRDIPVIATCCIIWLHFFATHFAALRLRLRLKAASAVGGARWKGGTGGDWPWMMEEREEMQGERRSCCRRSRNWPLTHRTARQRNAMWRRRKLRRFFRPGQQKTRLLCNKIKKKNHKKKSGNKCKTVKRKSQSWLWSLSRRRRRGRGRAADASGRRRCCWSIRGCPVSFQCPVSTVHCPVKMQRNPFRNKEKVSSVQYSFWRS